MSITLAGKVGFITGASQGLGLAIATVLHRAGATVAINYWPDPAGVNKTNAEALVAKLGERAWAVAGDVRSASDMAAAMDGVKARYGRLDLVVNNAGILRDKSFKKMTADEWQQVIDTNLTAVFTVCKAAEPHLGAGGRIVNISSISAALGFFGQANYAAAKAGVIGFTRVLARELARRQITANTVAPGLVLTDMGKSIPPEEREKMAANIPLGRFGEPEDIANAILFLCSDLAGYITGQTLHVNGGWHPA